MANDDTVGGREHVEFKVHPKTGFVQMLVVAGNGENISGTQWYKDHRDAHHAVVLTARACNKWLAAKLMAIEAANELLSSPESVDTDDDFQSDPNADTSVLAIPGDLGDE